MTYDELPAEDKALLDNMTNLIRAWCGEQARANNHGEVIRDDYVAQTQAILNSLDAGEEVPNMGGLAGAQALSKEELTEIATEMVGILGTYNTSSVRQKWIKACGAQNMLG